MYIKILMILLLLSSCTSVENSSEDLDCHYEGEGSNLHLVCEPK